MDVKDFSLRDPHAKVRQLEVKQDTMVRSFASQLSHQRRIFKHLRNQKALKQPAFRPSSTTKRLVKDCLNSTVGSLRQGRSQAT